MENATNTKNAISSGDRIQAEYYFQFADHYSRLTSQNGTQEKVNKYETNKEEEKIDSMENENTDQETIESSGVDESDNHENEDIEDSLQSVSFLAGNTEK